MSKHMELKLEEFIKETMFYKDIPGIAIAISRENEILYSKGFGVANMELKQPITPKTIFHMASVTKTLVSTAIMQLEEKKLLDISQPVIDYLPYFRMKDGRYQFITIKQLLSHTSGMPDCEDYQWERPEYDNKALERYVRSMDNYTLMGEPGERFRYSNIAYEILGDVIAKVSGETFEDYIQRHILQPLRMFDSTLLLQNIKFETLARPHVKNEEKKVVLSRIFPYNRKHAPSSTMYSNVLDISRWGMVHLNGGKLNRDRILQASTIEHMWTPIVPIPGEEQTMGLGWFLGRYEGFRTVGHEGSDIGFRSSFALVPDKKISVIVLANAHYASTKKIMFKAMDMALNI